MLKMLKVSSWEERSLKMAARAHSFTEHRYPLHREILGWLKKEL